MKVCESEREEAMKRGGQKGENEHSQEKDLK